MGAPLYSAMQKAKGTCISVYLQPVGRCEPSNAQREGYRWGTIAFCHCGIGRTLKPLPPRGAMMRKILLLMLVLVSSAAHAERGRLTQEFHWHLGAG